MEAFERANFRMSGDDLEVHEARIALERLLANVELDEGTRIAVELALHALRDRPA